ncbi:LamG-like jellyroll fold domain-containing protein [Candidatus Pelagibacter sp.]|uniref:LamG-like jellyroll fold domain-containing protein n=1 Tax=Candidatus Pelagibacter sp. TaxID=2024849 RepID=UPI003F83783F
MKNKKNQKGFALVFVIAVIAALSVMTTSMFFYYDNDLKSVSRNSVMQQVMLASETGLQEGQKWITDQLNADTFGLADIQNNAHVDASDNACLNRHGYTDATKDVYFAKRLFDNLGTDDPKFEDVEYEVFVQRHADYVRSIYFSAEGPTGIPNADTDYTNRSFAFVKKFKDFPTDQFTIEMWIKNERTTSSYNMHAFEWGREWDLVFKVLNDKWSPRLGEVVLAGSGSVGTPVKDEWVHIAWVWDGGNSAGNVRIYQNGELSGTYTADIGPRAKAGYTNPDDTLPEGDHWPLAIGEGLHGFTGNNYVTGAPKIQGVPWLGNIAEMRIWNISRTETDIANNNRRRITGSEPGLVSYYKFNEGAGDTAKDFNTSRTVDRRNDAKIYGIGTKGTKWETELAYYPTTVTDSTPDNDSDDEGPTVNVPPGEDVVLYKILSCGKGPQDQLIPLELIVSAPVSEGDVGDGKITLSEQDVSELSGQDGSPLSIPLNNYIGDEDVDGDIKISTSNETNSDFYVFKRALEQCTNATTYGDFSVSSTYTEGQCAENDDKLWYAEEAISADDFNEEQWSEVLGSGCDGIQFRSNNNSSNGHYYKYFTTRPNISNPTQADAISWDEARRRAEMTTCGGMRGYLVSVDNAAENNFIRDAIDNDSGITFHGAAGLTRSEMYGSNFDSNSDQHYVWLGNSDWRVEGTMASESGPDMGNTNSYTNWQTNEPNDVGTDPGEDYADMEINRSVSRPDGGWNDLPLRPTPSGALDAISGYIVEYGGWDYTDIDLDLNNDGDTNDANEIDEDTKICYARATIRKAEYVKDEDYLFYDTTFDDAPTGIVADTSSANDSQLDEDSETDGNQNTHPGWNHNTGVLTLIHTDLTGSSPTVPAWSGSTSYSTGDYVWFNNRVWQALSSISSSSTNTDQVPTLYNTAAWELVDGNDSGDPCAPISDWLQAFEGIKYLNSKVANQEDDAGEIDPEDGTDNNQGNDNDAILPKLGERVVTFSLGPLHIYNHTDGFQHFYEFYSFPTPTARFDDPNRSWSKGLRYANNLRYFGKQGYLANITSLDESEVLREKVKSTGWLGGIRTGDGDSESDIEQCGGLRQLSEPRGRRSADDYDRIFKDTVQNYTSIANGASVADDSVFFTETSGRRTIYQNRSGSAITLANPKPATPPTTFTKVWVDTPNSDPGSSFDTNCTLWRWVTGPESFLDNGVGLVWDKGLTGTSDWDRNGTTEGVEFGTEIVSTAAQIGEVFKDNGSPFEDWAITHPNEPNNAGREWVAHTVGLGNCDARSGVTDKAGCKATYELYWNDLPDRTTWSGNGTFDPKGLVIEYGGLENESDPRLRFSTQRVIKLQERQVNQARISISAGSQTGDAIEFGTDELSDISVTATNNNSNNILLEGEASCSEYLGLLRSAKFKHTASTAGQRTIKVSIGNVTKPSNAEHYYQVVEKDVTYAQADFQASYQNLCGLQGYLAYVKTAEDATAVAALTLEAGKNSWVNGSDSTIGGTFAENEWRFTSGPEYLESFWKVRSGTDASVTNFEDDNFASGQPSSGGADFLIWDHDNTQLEQDDGDANSDISSFIVRYGGSVGDFAEADVEEDNNNIDIVLPPLKAEISFYTDGSDNSIYMNGEDTLKIDSSDLGAGWSTVAFSGNSTPLELTAPANTSTTVEQFKKQIAKVYYQNCSKGADCTVTPTTYTPGNRKIKITLVYGDTSLNQTIGVVKTIGSRNKVNVTPISWSNR